MLKDVSVTEQDEGRIGKTQREYIKVKTVEGAAGSMPSCSTRTEGHTGIRTVLQVIATSWRMVAHGKDGESKVRVHDRYREHS